MLSCFFPSDAWISFYRRVAGCEKKYFSTKNINICFALYSLVFNKGLLEIISFYMIREGVYFLFIKTAALDFCNPKSILFHGEETHSFLVVPFLSPLASAVIGEACVQPAAA